MWIKFQSDKKQVECYASINVKPKGWAGGGETPVYTSPEKLQRGVATFFFFYTWTYNNIMRGI